MTLPLLCDDLGIVCDSRKRTFKRIAWDSIRRIGFAVESVMRPDVPLIDHRFLVIQESQRLCLLSVELPGFGDAMIQLQRRFPFTLGPLRLLENTPEPDDLVVWPQHEAEDSIFGLASVECGQNVPVTFFVNDPPPG